VIADDSAVASRFLASTLVDMGHTIVAQCPSSTSAIAACGKFRPDVAILDISMPPNNDFSHVARILESGTVTHVVIASILVSTLPSEIEKWRALGVLTLKKPIDKYDVLKLFREIEA
jgi:chemotaxis response regulator CheB